MSASRVPATIDALVTRWAAAMVTADASVQVWDGPVVTGDPSDAVFVGYDGDPDGDMQSATAEQDWAGLGAKQRTERFTVTCAAVALIGSGDVKTGRDRAFLIFEVAAANVRADPSLGQTPTPFVAAVTGPQLFTDPTDRGLQARVVFGVSVETRI